MTHKLTIPGLFPGLNDYSDAERSSRYAAADMKKTETNRVAIYARQQLRRPIKPPVFIKYTWYEIHRQRDKDNIAFAKKFVQDGLVAAGVLPNDGWKQIEGFSDGFAVDKGAPRVEIEIIEVCD